jgi:hypothetical protein
MNKFEAIKYESILKFQDYFKIKNVEKNVKKQIELSVTNTLPLIEGRHTEVANPVTEVIKSY